MLNELQYYTRQQLSVLYKFIQGVFQNYAEYPWGII